MSTAADSKPPPESGPAPAQVVEESVLGAGTEDATKESSTPSFFRNNEPVREEQVQNAVKFLSHPKVRGSPVIHRRSFLERKGLTKEEIDEAFRRVPDPAPSAQAPAASTDAQIISTSSSTAYPVTSAQALPPASATSSGTVSPVAIISRSRFHWTHAIFAIGFLAISGAGTAVLFKNSIIPRLKSWIRKIVSEEDNAKKISSRPNSAEEAAAAAKAAAAAATEVARASQEMLAFKLEEKKYFGDLVNLLDVQLREIKSMRNAVRKLEGNGNTTDAISAFHQEYNRDWMTISKDIDDSPRDPNYLKFNSRIAPRAKPWEAGQSQSNTSFAHQPSPNEGGRNYYGAENGVVSKTNGGSSGPWWQKKNVRITEVDQHDELKTGTYSSQFGGQPVRSSWVPPQPPPIAMREAAEAIRRPKPTAQKDLADDQLMARSSKVSEELQKATKFSETGGSADTNSLGMPTNGSIEIQDEKEPN